MSRQNLILHARVAIVRIRTNPDPDGFMFIIYFRRRHFSSVRRRRNKATYILSANYSSRFNFISRGYTYICHNQNAPLCVHAGSNTTIRTLNHLAPVPSITTTTILHIILLLLIVIYTHNAYSCLLYTSPSPRDKRQSRMPSSA